MTYLLSVRTWLRDFLFENRSIASTTSVWIKTEDFTPQVEIKVLNAKGDSVSYTYLNVQPTQDWTEHHVTFNSLDHDKLNFYIGVWGPKTGRLWLRDAKLESTGAVNLLRRPTAPIQVQWLNGQDSVYLKESVDFEPWADPRLGTVPYLGEYDESPEQINRWLDVVSESHIRNVNGVMYTTWVKNYNNMEAFARNAKRHRWYHATR
jgi:hypothetical protein